MARDVRSLAIFLVLFSLVATAIAAPWPNDHESEEKSAS